MTTPRSSTAVLLFTRLPAEEAAHKRFVSHGTRAGNATVAAHLIGHATRTAQLAGVDFVCVDSRSQIGATFGERLSGALQHVFAQGYEHLLVIGNDCPQLDAALLGRAVAAVATTGAVLGPATDGGVYLIGVSRKYFDADTWARLPWQTAQLGAALARQLRTAGATVPQLPPLADIDSEQDLARTLRQLRRGALRRNLQQLRTPAHESGQQVVRGYAAAFGLAQPHRGPPVS